MAWAQVKPKYLDFEYCQILLIGENVDKAVEPTKKDQKHDKETPQAELEQLEHEDELRVQHLHGEYISCPILNDFMLAIVYCRLLQDELKAARVLPSISCANPYLGDDTVFDDLKISKEEYSKVPTTW